MKSLKMFFLIIALIPVVFAVLGIVSILALIFAALDPDTLDKAVFSRK